MNPGANPETFLIQMLRCALHDTLAGHFEKVRAKSPASCFNSRMAQVTRPMASNRRILVISFFEKNS
jgi:hypothetical protein